MPMHPRTAKKVHRIYQEQAVRGRSVAEATAATIGVASALFRRQLAESDIREALAIVAAKDRRVAERKMQTLQSPSTHAP